MTMEVRPAASSDIPAMAALRAEAWESAVFWEPRIQRYLSGEPRLAMPARAVFVAVEAGSLVGFVAGHRTTRFRCDGELQWINVAQKGRQREVAGLLIGTIAHWFIGQGALQICVDVEPKNSAARALYAKFGARQLNDHWMVWDDIRTATVPSNNSSSRS